jgi:hypothetical protein
MIVVPILFILVGVALIVWPDTVRKYDQGLTRVVKTRDEYVWVIRMLGGFFVFFGVTSLVLLLLGVME